MSPQDPTQKEKFEALNRFLEDEYVMAHLDTANPDLVIPQHLKAQATVTLKLSRLFRGGIEVSSDRVVTNLMFNQKYFACIIPLSAIWGLTSEKGENILWPASTPTQVMKEVISTVEKTEPASKIARKKVSHLKRIK